MSNDLLPAPAFDPGSISLDFDRDEKRRMTALMLATKYHVDTVIKDGELYNAMKLNGKNFKTLYPKEVVETAQLFENYMKTGQLKVTEDEDGGVHVKIGEEDDERAEVVAGETSGQDE